MTVQEPALYRRYRLSRELAAMRKERNEEGVNPNTGKRARRTKEQVGNVATDIVIEQTSGIEIEPGTYDAVLSNIEEVENRFYATDPANNSPTQLKLEFSLIDVLNDEGNPITWSRWVNPTFSPTSTLYKYVAAITGGAPRPSEPFRTSALIGKPCRVFINSVTKKDGGTTKKIVDVLGPKVAAPAAPVKKASPLVARLAEDKCCVPNCRKVVSAYDGDGNAFCANHQPAGNVPDDIEM